MKLRWIAIILLSFAFAFQTNAQVTTSPKGKKVDARQKEQIQIDEQLASQAFRDHEYEKARDLYADLYQKTNLIHYFQQYIECLIQLKDFDHAEKELKSFAKKNPIQDFLGDVLAEDPAGKAVTSWKDLEKYAVLALCGFDLAMVEAKARQYKNPRSTSIPKMMEPYREILAGLPSGASTWTKGKLLSVL